MAKTIDYYFTLASPRTYLAGPTAAFPISYVWECRRMVSAGRQIGDHEIQPGLLVSGGV